MGLLAQIVDELNTRPLFIVGSPGAGKTVFTKILVDELLKKGASVRVFDASLAWWHNSPLPRRVSVSPFDEFYVLKDVLFDVGRLEVKERSKAIRGVVEQVFSHRYELKLRDPEFMEKVNLDVTVIEESQSMFSKYGDLGRMQDWTAMGRNFRMTAIHTTQRGAEARTEMLERCNILVGYTTHENNLKKLAKATDKEFMRRLRAVRPYSHEFLYYNGDTYGPFTVTPRTYGEPRDVENRWDISLPGELEKLFKPRRH